MEEGTAFLAKAEESLASAEADGAGGRFNSAANRAYDACFQAAVAALIGVGVGPSRRDQQWRHDAVKAQFAEQCVNRRKLYPSELTETLERLARLREIADYRSQSVPVAHIGRAVRQARVFVQNVRAGQERRRG